MTKTVKQLVFVFSGLVIITAFFLFTKSFNVEAAQKDKKQFHDWTTNCSKSGSDEICMAVQNVLSNEDKDSKDQKVLAIYRFGYLNDAETNKKLLKFICSLPPDILVKPGVGIVVDKEIVITAEFILCNSGSCQAEAVISDQTMEKIAKGKEYAVIFMNTEQKQVGIPFSAKGLQEALAFLSK